LKSYIYILFVFIGILIVNTNKVLATHLAGGELTYQCLGQNSNGLNRYRVNFILYRDCSNPANVNFDASVTIYAFRVSDAWVQDSLIISSFVTDTLQMSLNDTCAELPPGLCYARARYTGFIDLPDNNFGYDLSWSRCCRNNTTINIINPQGTGSTLTVRIPPTVLCNNSPEFNSDPGMALCLGLPYSFMNSASDPDGDSLSYHLLTPLLGGSATDPIPMPVPPPFQEVNWNPPFSVNNILGGVPPLQVNPLTGMVSANPEFPGQFALCIAVREYRNGIFLSEVRRDYQLNVVMCLVDVPPVVGVPQGPEPVVEEMLFYAGQPNCYTFEISDDPNNFLVFNAEGDIFGALPGNVATFNGAGYGNVEGRLCWMPECNQAGYSGWIYVSANDNNNCPGPNYTRDTFRIRVIPPPVQSPEIRCVSALGNERIQLDWMTLEPVPGFSRYEIYRSYQDQTVETLVSSISDSSIHTWIDTHSGAYQNQPTYRIQTFYNCPQDNPGSITPTVSLLMPQVESLSPVIVKLDWQQYPVWENPSYSLWKYPSEFRVAEDITNISYEYQDCDYYGAFIIQTKDPLTGCRVISAPTEYVRMYQDPPGYLQICAASVLLENTGIQVSWYPPAYEEGFRLVLLRRHATESDFNIITYPVSDALVYVDADADIKSGRVEYRIAYENPCGIISGISETAGTTFLQVSAQSGWFDLSWTSPTLLGGIYEYEVYVRDEERINSHWLVKGRHPSDGMLIFRDDEILNEREEYCYRIRVYGNIDACTREVWSNTACERPEPSLNVPTGFSPNGDGINDFFTIPAFAYENIQLMIYDSWGNKVFEGNGRNVVWDGSHNGRACPQGVYIYRLSANGFNGQELNKHGTITLIR